MENQFIKDSYLLCSLKIQVALWEKHSHQYRLLSDFNMQMQLKPQLDLFLAAQQQQHTFLQSLFLELSERLEAQKETYGKEVEKMLLTIDELCMDLRKGHQLNKDSLEGKTSVIAGGCWALN